MAANESNVLYYTREEVRKRNGGGDGPVWIIYKDVVYDVTRYVLQHPGGDDTILNLAGEDATKDFDSVGHSGDAKTILKKLKVGEIIEEERYYDANGKKLKRRVVAEPEGKEARSCLNIITCGLIG